MTIRRTLVYADEAAARDRWLGNDELERVFIDLTGIDVEEADFWVPPRDLHHINIHFLGGTLPPERCLDGRIRTLFDGESDDALRIL